MSVEPNIGLCLSGGGSRAVAFHLGCLRALNRRGILSRVKIISSVSGGSVISGIYAYGSDDFEDFDKRTIEFLKQGLVASALKKYFFRLYFVPEGLNLLLIWIVWLFEAVVGRIGIRVSKWLNVPRPFSRSNIFVDTIDSKLFKGRKLNSIKRPGLQVVFNSTELTTCTAFRFGNNEISCWKFGKIESSAMRVADAVGSSAAYPVLLPSIDRKLVFKNQKGEHRSQRVVLADGGIYENLGLSPLFPDRGSEFGYSAVKCNLIIACDAGNKFEDVYVHSQWMVPRLVKCFTTVMRRVQSLNFKVLHDYQASGKIDRFILANLSQDDSKLPSMPKDFVQRESVEDYPTDFFAMRDSDIEKLSKRGEQLVDILVDHYLPGI